MGHPVFVAVNNIKIKMHNKHDFSCRIYTRGSAAAIVPTISFGPFRRYSSSNHIIKPAKISK